MTIEARIAELTLAVDHLAAVIQGGAQVPASKPAKNVSPSIDKAAPAAPMVAPAATPAAATPAAKALTYDDIKVPFLALVKKNRDLALATLKPFGLDSLKPAKPEQFAAILEALNAALAA